MIRLVPILDLQKFVDTVGIAEARKRLLVAQLSYLQSNPPKQPELHCLTIPHENADYVVADSTQLAFHSSRLSDVCMVETIGTPGYDGEVALLTSWRIDADCTWQVTDNVCVSIAEAEKELGELIENYGLDNVRLLSLQSFKTETKVTVSIE